MVPRLSLPKKRVREAVGKQSALCLLQNSANPAGGCGLRKRLREETDWLCWVPLK